MQEEADIASDSATSNTTTPTNMDLEAAANNPPVWPTPLLVPVPIPIILEDAANNPPPVWPTPVPTILEAVAEEEIPQAENEVVDEEPSGVGGELEKNLDTEETAVETTTASTTTTAASPTTTAASTTTSAASTDLPEESSPAIEDINLWMNLLSLYNVSKIMYLEAINRFLA